MDYVSANLDLDSLYKEIKCNADTIYRMNGVWEGPDPLNPVVPLFLLQLTVAVLFTRLLIITIKPFHQPPFVAEILSGILLGPSAFGKFDVFKHMLFPTYYFQVLEPMAHYALVLYAFLMGLQMDVKAISRTGTQAMHVATTGIFFPMIIGAILYAIFSDPDDEAQGAFFWGAALSVTGFSVLKKILEQRRLLLTEIGKTALASALLSDLASWFFLAVGLALTVKNSVWIILCTSAVVLLCAFYLRPALNWIVRKTPEGQGYSEYYVCSILSGASLMSVITDVCGTHPMIGAFLFGLIVPNDVLESVLLDRFGDFVNGVLMPVFFLVCGLRANLDDIGGPRWHEAAIVMIFAFGAKILAAMAASFLHDLQLGEAVAVGVLTNTKSTVALIILEIGVSQGPLTSKTYSLMLVCVLVMTMIVTPAAIRYRPTKNSIPYKRRSVQKAKSDEELRILACIYDTKNIPYIINLLEVSNSTQRSKITVFALHLVELVGRASAMLVVHTSHRSGPRNPSYLEAQTDQIVTALDNFELRSEGVHTQVLTARSAYATMDEDICSIANDKRASIIILPFHRQKSEDGELENESARNVNESVMANAPCSVGILIGRGTFGTVDLQHHARNIAMLFFGGPDDREALCYAWRMAEHAETRLKVVRFVPDQEVDDLEWDPMGFPERDEVTIQIDSKRERVTDDDLLNKFKISTVNDASVQYLELVLNDEEEAVQAIKEMDRENHDLYIVGKGRGVISPLTAGLTDWCDCPELGPIGDLLVTSEFDSTFSVLVVQQYVRKSSSIDDMMMDPISQKNEVDFRASEFENENFEQFHKF